MPRFALIADGIVANVVLVEDAVDIETDDQTGAVIRETPVPAAEYAARLFGPDVLEVDDDDPAGPGWTVTGTGTVRTLTAPAPVEAPPAPPTPVDELRAAILAADTLEDLKAALTVDPVDPA